MMIISFETALRVGTVAAGLAGAAHGPPVVTPSIAARLIASRGGAGGWVSPRRSAARGRHGFQFRVSLL